MNVVVKNEPSSEVMEYASGLLDVIARAARDPNVDIDKMERLIAMQERVQSRNAEIAFNAALAELQPGLPVINERGGIKDRNGNVQSTYALWEDVNEAIRPLLAMHGFALRFRVERTGDQISVTGILSHRDGHSEQTTLSLPADGSGSKNAVQAVGSSTSYGKRYTAFALLNITTTGEDDDGRKGGMVSTITLKQYDELLRRMSEVGADHERFVSFLQSAKLLKGEDLSELPVTSYERALAELAKKVTAK